MLDSLKKKNLKNKFLPKVCYLQFWQQFLQENIGWHQTSVWALFVHCPGFLHLQAESKANQAGLAANFCVFQGHWPTKNRWCWQGWNKKRSIKSKDIWGRKKWLFPNAKWRSQIDSLALANKNKINLNEKVNDKSIKGLNLIYQGQDSFYWLFYPSDANVCSTKAMSWPILLLVLKT